MNSFGILKRALHTTSGRLNTGSPNDKGSSGNNGKNNPNDDEKRAIIMKALFFFFVAYTLFLLTLKSSTNMDNQGMKFVSWNEFIHHMVAQGEVEEVVVLPEHDLVRITLHDGAVIKGKKVETRKYYLKVADIQGFESNLREEERSLGIAVKDGIPVEYERGNNFGILLLLILLLFFMLRKRRNEPFFQIQMGGMKSTKANFTMIDPSIPGSGKGVKFSDVAGAKEAKQEVMEIVDFLKNPDRYQRLGAKVPKGALLLGPPGCGKTLLAKAVATEGKVPFLAMNGSEFIELIGGLGASRVRDLFKEARTRTPCIIYIDEIDAIGRRRGQGGGSGVGDGEGEQTLNQLLVEMDGMGSKSGVILLASTNRLDILDKALLRPGRFDRHIMLDLPTQEERKEIFEHHLKAIVLEKPVTFYSNRMASLTLGFSGADIANVVNEAALYAARNARKIVLPTDLEYAVERVIGGAEKITQVLSPEERKVVAYHESGHALMGWLLEHTDALLKVTIVPRTNQALGFAQYAPKDQKLYTQEEIFERMCMALGGRVAESLTFNRITTGAQNDLEKVTKMAYAQVRSFGFSDAVGQVSFAEEESREQGRRPYSDRLAALIDEEANKLIFQAYKKTEQILKENADKKNCI